MSALNGSTSSGVSRRSWIGVSVFVIGVFVLVWLVVALRWKATSHVPSGAELLLDGIALPLLIVASVVWIRKGLGASRSPRDTAAPAAQAPAETTVDDASTKWTMALFDSSLRLPAGTTPEEALSVAREGKGVGLHPELQRPNGTRVFAGAVASISHDDFDSSLLPSGSSADWSDEQRRAMLLAAESIDELMQRHAVTSTPDSGDTLNAASRFKLHLLLPDRWRSAAPTLAVWLDMYLERGRWNPGAEMAKIIFVAHPAQALLALDALNIDIHQQELPVRHIVLACDSSVSQDTVNALDAAGQLYGQSHPGGHVLGEGACALLLGHPSAGTSRAARIHRVVTSARPAPVDQPDQQQGDTVAHLLDRALAQCAIPGLEMTGCALISDADQRGTRRAEIVNAAQLTWPDSDIRIRCHHLGQANGESGAVLALGAVAVAGAHAHTEKQPTFVTTLSDPVMRGVVLVSTGASLSPSDDVLSA